MSARFGRGRTRCTLWLGTLAMTMLPCPRAPAAPAPIPTPATATATAARTARPALFVLIMGVNRSPDPDLAALRYADDDAARYWDLFRGLGAHTALLATMDENTRTLHPAAHAEAKPARTAELVAAVASMREGVRQARARGQQTVLYVTYAGHGDANDDRAALTLEDGQIDADHLLTDVVQPVAADETHVIIDACHAHLFALARGPGGARRQVEGFVDRFLGSRGTALGDGGPSRVGFILASSSTGDSHEWAGFEAGVFSHEVRSGLYGAADADGDGIITYPEIAAFVTRANASIVAERFRPQIIAQQPGTGNTLLDLRAHTRNLRFEGETSSGHFLLEDRGGVRVVDFHASGRVPVSLVRPPGTLFVRRLPAGEERALPDAPGPVGVLDLPLAPARDVSRGAAAHAFAQAFALPFDEDAVASYERATVMRQRANAQTEGGRTRTERRRMGTVALGISAACLLAAGALTGAALAARGADGAPSQKDIGARNEAIRTRVYAADGALAGAAVSGLLGAYLLWKF